METLKASIDRSISGGLRCERITKASCGRLDFIGVKDAALNRFVSLLKSQRLFRAGTDYKS